MKNVIQELIAEKGRELAAMGIALLLVAAGVLAAHFYTQGGSPFVPEEITATRAEINKALSKGINAMEDTISNLNELLRLEKEGNTSEIIQKVPVYKTDLAKVGQVLLNMPQDIQTIADLISQVRPRSAGKPLSEAMGQAAQASIELLRLREDMVVLYDDLDARARGEKTEEYNLIVDRVNRQGSLINSLYDEFHTKIAEFRDLTKEHKDE